MLLSTRARGFVAVVSVAFALRAAHLSAVGPSPRFGLAPDSRDYLLAARNLSLHAAFSADPDPPLRPETFRTPGYPLLLAVLCGEDCPDSRRIAWAQALLGAGTAGLTYLTGLLLWGSAGAALAGGLGMALDAVAIWHTGLVLTDTLFAFLLGLALVLMARACYPPPEPTTTGPWAAGAGLACGAAALVRPIGLYYFLFAAGAMALAPQGRRGRRGLLMLLLPFVLAAGLPPAAWMARNRSATGSWIFSSIQGLNLFLIRAAAVEMELSGSNYNQALSKLRRELRLEDPMEAASRSSAEAKRIGDWAGRFILSHPWTYAKVMGRDLVKMLGGHGLEMPAWLELKDERYNPLAPRAEAGGGLSGTRGLLRRHPRLLWPLLAYLAFLAATYLLAFAGLVAVLRNGDWGRACLAACLAAYVLAVSCGGLTYYRFRLPAMPSIFLLAGRGALALRRHTSIRALAREFVPTTSTQGSSFRG